MKYFFIVVFIICFFISSLFLSSCNAEGFKNLLLSEKNLKESSAEELPPEQDRNNSIDSDYVQEIVPASEAADNDGGSGKKTNLQPENDLMFLSSEADFSFVYPHNNLSLSSYPDQSGDFGDMSLSVCITDVDTLTGDSREAALAEMEALENGSFGPDTDFSFEPSRKVKERSGVNVKEYLVFGRYDICDVIFERKAVFYNNGSQVQITLCADREKITESMGGFFTSDETKCLDEKMWSPDGQGKFYEQLVSQQAAPLALEWYGVFDKIMYLLQINEHKGASAGYSRIIEKRYYEENEEENYTIDISYPQFQSAVAGGLDESINKIIFENIILSNMDAFKAEIAAYGNEEDFFNYLLSIAYRVVTYNDNGISLCMEIYPYLGGAHGMTYYETINFDLNNNKLISLKDLFKKNYGFLKVISEYCRRDLVEQMINKDMTPDEAWIEEGTKPDMEDYFKNFLVAPDGLVIKFSAYQVAPYADGDFSVIIPYSQFEGNINSSSMIAQYALSK